MTWHRAPLVYYAAVRKNKWDYISDKATRADAEAEIFAHLPSPRPTEDYRGARKNKPRCVTAVFTSLFYNSQRQKQHSQRRAHSQPAETIQCLGFHWISSRFQAVGSQTDSETLSRWDKSVRCGSCMWSSISFDSRASAGMINSTEIVRGRSGCTLGLKNHYKKKKAFHSTASDHLTTFLFYYDTF